MTWCWAGLAMVAACVLPLAEARDLLSVTERLWGFETGSFAAIEELGVENASWALEVTPLGAWWGIVVGAVMAVVGWQGRRALPFGWLGAAIWLTTFGQLLAGNLLTQFAMGSAQTLCCGLWLARFAAEPDAQRNIWSFLRAALVGDAFGLWGVLLAGLAWGTGAFSQLFQPDVLHEGWTNQPAACGLAGLLLFLSILGRGGLFPLVSGTRIAERVGFAESSRRTTTKSEGGREKGEGKTRDLFSLPTSHFRLPPSERFASQSLGKPYGETCDDSPTALVLSVCVWPGLLWHLVRIQPLLGVAPETVALVQGWSLLAAGAAAWIAAGQTDARRIVALLATSQIALLISILAVPGAMTPVGMLLLMLTLSASTASLFAGLAAGVSRWLCWGMLTAGCLSPMFWLSAQGIEQFQTWPAPSAAVDENTAESDADDSYRVQPLPVPTWTAAWCIVSCCGAFAAWRAAMGEINKDSPPLSVSPSRILSVLLLACAASAGWLTLRGGVMSVHWPIGAAIASTLVGVVAARRVGRSSASPFPRPGGWADFARRELGLPEVWERFRAGWLSPFVDLACFLEQPPASRRAGNPWVGAARRIVEAADELHSEPDLFYAVALLSTIGSLLLTWWTLAG